VEKRFLCVTLLAFMVFPVFPQASARVPYYQIIFDAEAPAAYKESFTREMAERFNFYNRRFRFNPADMVSSTLTVRIFSNKAEYDNYVSSKLGRVQAGAVYLHLRRVVSRELVLHRGSEAAKTELPRQAFFQYFCAFVPNPPSWLKEGFAVYYTNLSYDEDDSRLLYQENLTWLPVIKNLGANGPSLESVLSADTLGMPANFQALAWSLISFFTTAGTEYANMLAEIIRSLSSIADNNTNSETALQIIQQRIGLEGLREAYDGYFASRKTFTEVITEGQRAYNAKDYVTADLRFLQALDLQPAHYMPYYYLGLSAFETKIHELAEYYFRAALEHGADQAMVYYAMGLNAIAWGRNTEAEEYLERAVQIDPAQYRTRVTDTLARIR
jgi:tetratricopeptide (TPR) repeat protein